MSEISVLTVEGDLRVQWKKGSAKDVEAARKMFDELKSKGWIAFSVRATGRKGKMMTEFDEDAEKVIMMPPPVGG
jgi:hypothetical protein